MKIVKRLKMLKEINNFQLDFGLGNYIDGCQRHFHEYEDYSRLYITTKDDNILVIWYYWPDNISKIINVIKNIKKYTNIINMKAVEYFGVNTYNWENITDIVEKNPKILKDKNLRKILL